MKIIQVHVHDGDLTSTVSNLLNQGFTISVDLDVLDDGPTAVEARQQLDAELKREHRRMKIRAQRAEADAFIAEREARNNRYRENDYQRAKSAAEREMFRDVDATTVECRTCGALVGAGCHKASGEMAQTPHVWRVRAAYEAQGR